ncbi:phosphodiester glycosidase family protein [Candidatus Curtissbacteria bacterium]|nr:phosphodiester glycosidase family protein [Candidatus Curtissbacteria bacterium]
MKSKNIKRFQPLSFRLIILSFVSLILILVAIFAIYSLFVKNGQTTKLLDNSSIQIVALQKDLEETRKVLFNLEISDQIKVNNELNTEIKNIQKTFNEAVVVYEDIVDLRVAKINTQKIDEKFSTILKSLADKKYTDAETKITETRALIKTENDKLTASTIASVSTANLTSSNSTPDSGYRRQQVSTDIGSFVVDIVTADLGSTKVIVDTASDGDCRNDCPVMSVGNYASRSGAYAAINGSYFCPASYPSCSDKKNSFDTLLMNKNKTYFNSDNNVYSTVPAVIFSSQSRFVSQSLEWGRDTSVDGVIANQPLLTHNGQLLFGGDSDAKKTSKANRSFVGSSGNKVFMGVVYSASVAEAAKVLHTLGIQNSLNLDSGGSTAFWVGGYKAGPGRDVPNAVLFVKR